MPGGEGGLVRLKVADQLPGDGSPRLGALLNAFLDAIFADGADPVPGRVFRGGGRMGLCHGEQLNPACRPARPGAGLRDPSLYGIGPLYEFLIGKIHVRKSNFKFTY